MSTCSSTGISWRGQIPPTPTPSTFSSFNCNFLKLEFQDSAKQAAAMTTQLLTAADHTSPSNRNPTSQQLLKDQIKVLTNFFKNRLLKGGVMKRLMLNVLFFFQPTEEHVEKLNQAIQDNMNDPNNPTTQLNLINTSKDFIPVNIQH